LTDTVPNSYCVKCRADFFDDHNAMEITGNIGRPAARGERVTIILNPAAGRGQGARRRAELERLLAHEAGRAPSFTPAAPVQWNIVETTAPGSGVGLAAAAVAAGAHVVAACGGDGTYGEVVNGMVGSGARLGILPLGTGNDFARCLGFGTDLKRAVHTLFHGTPRAVDLGRVQGRWFINVAGCGFDAVVARRVNAQRDQRILRHIHGTAAYITAVVQSLITFQPAAIRLTLDGQTCEGYGMLCAVANAPSYGGGMRVAPDAEIDDGLFDLCIIGDTGRLEFLRAFPRVFNGTHVTHPRVAIVRARHIVIESDPPLPVLVDGDVLCTTPAEFTLTPRAIEVMAP
jgi:diacylglycerol kinase (ATP)